MQLLRDLEFEPKCWCLDRRDSRERQEIGATEHLGSGLGRDVEPHVDHERLEYAARELSSDVEPDRGALQGLVDVRCPVDREHEEVTEVGGLHVEHGHGRIFLAARHRDVDIACCPRVFPEAIVEGKPALEEPATGRHRKEPGEQAVEGHLLAQPRQGRAGLLVPGEKPILKCAAERWG